jgi:Zn-dependent protease
MAPLIARAFNSVRLLTSLQVQANPWAAVPALILWSWSDSLFGTVGGITAFVVLVGSLVIHELGHIALATANNVPVKAIGFSPAGSYIRRERAPSPLAELAITLAGPAASVLLAIVFLSGSSGTSHWLGKMNLVIAGSNLLPLKGCDGYRALLAVRAILLGS